MRLEKSQLSDKCKFWTNFLDNNDNIIKMRDVKLESKWENRGLGDIFFEKMIEHKDKLFLIDIEDDKKYTFGTMLTRSIRTAIHLKEMGLKENDLLCLCSYNRIDAYVCFISSMLLGLRFSSIERDWSKPFKTNIINQMKPKHFFIEEGEFDAISEIIEAVGINAKITVFSNDSKFDKFEKYISPVEGEHKFEPFKIKDSMETALILWTSGTTGDPKGICMHHYGLYSKLLNAGHSSTINLIFSTLSWLSGPIFLTSSIIHGNTIINPKKYDPTTVWTIVEKYKANSLFVVTVYAILLEKLGIPENVDVSSLKFFFFAGSSFRNETIENLRKMLPHAIVMTAYGQSETIAGVTFFDLSDPEIYKMAMKKSGSSGMPIEGYWYKIVDTETNKILGPYEKGELLLKGKCITHEYCGLDLSPFDEDGWFHTGDIGYYDDDLCFYIVDRTSLMFKHHTYYIAPALIENVLMQHPGIELAGIVPIPNYDVVNNIQAVVTLKKSTKPLTEEEIMKYVEDNMEDQYRLRAGVKIVDKLPMTTTGKIDKKELIRLVRNNQI